MIDCRRVLLVSAIPVLAAAGCSLDESGLKVVPQNQPNSYTCGCKCTASSVVANVAVTASTDDAEQIVSTGAMSLTGQHLDMTAQDGVQGGAQQLVGVRFLNVGLAAGSLVTSAVVQFTASQADVAAANLTIHGVKLTLAQTFSGTAFDISSLPFTTASVTWNPQAWAAGEATAAEQTPDLSPILNELASMTGWGPFSPVVLVVTGTGNRSAVSFDSNPASAPRLIATFGPPALAFDVPVCMTNAMNPNTNNIGDPPLASDLENDCSMRVEKTLSDMDAVCNLPSTCKCDAVATAPTRFVGICNDICGVDVVAGDCSNFDPKNGNVTATQAPGPDQPVCTVHSPLAASVFGRRSLCQVSGQATFQASGESQTPGASGTVDIVGTPCPGQSCAVDMTYAFSVGDITFGNLFGSATFSQLAALGETTSPTQLASDGSGLFAPNTTSSSARGQRDNGDVLALIGSNSDVVNVGVDWTPGSATCSLNGSLVGTIDPEEKRCEPASPQNANQLCQQDSDCGGTAQGCTGSNGTCQCLQVQQASANVAMSVSGPIVNQPPAASAGANQVVECNQPNSATFTLDGSASCDPDGNLAVFTWMKGSRNGSVVGLTPVVETQQPLGPTIPYFLRVIDTYGQIDEASSTVRVQDTTPPTLFCNAPALITPPSAPISFTATATDICDRNVVPSVTGFRCYKYTKSGIYVNKGGSCVVSFTGNTITIGDSGGVGDHIEWTLSATDQSGNAATATCATLVVRP